MTKKTCKRCGMVPRRDDPFHRGIGAMSRTDNKTEICSDCGVDEAMQDFMEGGCSPKNLWPLNRATTN